MFQVLQQWRPPEHRSQYAAADRPVFVDTSHKARHRPGLVRLRRRHTQVPAGQLTCWQSMPAWNVGVTFGLHNKLRIWVAD
ncbi:hypothetical protein XSP_000475 [Xanthomonas euroxanthea]|uniref:Uncharacterized protein n=1 Tax=Xanthomonas euroxanthea TaxID=2259622 RepID=A0A8E4DR30_9XANT|nr:hypothetical protein XSP_000475 [Xanthomonas euroxanthea]